MRQRACASGRCESEPRRARRPDGARRARRSRRRPAPPARRVACRARRSSPSARGVPPEPRRAGRAARPPRRSSSAGAPPPGSSSARWQRRSRRRPAPRRCISSHCSASASARLSRSRPISLDADLAQRAARLLLLGERVLELSSRDQLPVDQDRADPAVRAPECGAASTSQVSARSTPSGTEGASRGRGPGVRRSRPWRTSA